MSISPPSDIVLDVARAAEPARYRQAAARLESGAATGEAFDTVLTAQSGLTQPPGTAVAPPRDLPTRSEASPAKPADDADEVYRGFEAMALATLIEAAMAGEGSDYFGKGVAGETWKSLLVEQIADQMAKNGGIGIATQLARSARAAALDGDTDAAARTLLVTNTERSVLRALEGDASPAGRREL